MRNNRAYWNRKAKEGKRAMLNYTPPLTATAKIYQGKSGIIKGCTRGDRAKNDPYVSIWIDTNADGSKRSGFYWQVPAHCLKLIK